MLKRVLIANRGEIALRILRAEDVRSIPRGEKLIKLLHLK